MTHSFTPGERAVHPLSRRSFLASLGAAGVLGAGALGGLSLTGCSQSASAEGGAASAGASIEPDPSYKAPSQFTLDVNKSYLDQLNFDDRQDFEDAAKGFIATVDGDIYGENPDRPVWTLSAYEYQTDDAACPDTVNPSLWRQAQLNNKHGLFKVTDGVYQVRNFDIANLTIVEGEKGIIVIDCTTSDETSRAGLELYRQHVADREVTAVCITHSHTDHYGGITGVVTAEQAASGEIPIVVPTGFLAEVASENAYVGNIMSRRTYDQYGTILEKSVNGQVDTGLGKAMCTGGTHSVLPPNTIITEPIQTLVLDGVTFEFMLTPETEAPSEYVIYLPERKTLIPAEIINHTFHNIYTLRGAQVRDARKWWRSVDAMIQRYGDDVEVMCQTHHWPAWGNDHCVHLLEVTRDAYKNLHDQCLRMMNQGLTMFEVAEEFELAEPLRQEWAMRGYYGTWNHGAKAVYQRYLGWFDMNPAHLHALPPEPAAKHYVEAMGGADAVLGLTKKAFDEGDYRWAAEIGNHLVFAEPENKQALSLLADVYEQLGYQCECATWRCVYLMGATELRYAMDGKSANPTVTTANAALSNSMTDDMFFDYMALHLNAPRVGNDEIVLKVTQRDKETTWALKVANGVLNFHQDKEYPAFDAEVSVVRDDLSRIILGEKSFDDLLSEDSMQINGDEEKVRQFFSYFDVFSLDINVMLP